MGIIKNIKNLFIDVEEQEVVEEVKEEVKKEEVLHEEDYLQAESKFRFPIVFNDEDLISGNTLDVTLINKQPFKKPLKEEVKKEEEEVKKVEYNVSKPVLEKTKAILPADSEITYTKPKKFKPAPAISPVYGLLKKEEPKKEEPKKVPMKKYDIDTEINLSFDSVRKKAYGQKEDENVFIKETEELLNSFENETIDIKESDETINTLFTNLEEAEKELTEVENSTLLDIESVYNDNGNVNNTNMDEVDKYLEASFDTEDKDININFFKEDEVETEAEGLVDEALDKIIDDEFKTTREAKRAKNTQANELDENTVEYELFNLIDTMYENKDNKEGDM